MIATAYSLETKTQEAVSRAEAPRHCGSPQLPQLPQLPQSHKTLPSAVQIAEQQEVVNTDDKYLVTHIDVTKLPPFVQQAISIANSDAQRDLLPKEFQTADALQQLTVTGISKRTAELWIKAAIDEKVILCITQGYYRQVAVESSADCGSCGSCGNCGSCGSCGNCGIFGSSYTGIFLRC